MKVYLKFPFEYDNDTVIAYERHEDGSITTYHDLSTLHEYDEFHWEKPDFERYLPEIEALIAEAEAKEIKVISITAAETSVIKDRYESEALF